MTDDIKYLQRQLDIQREILRVQNQSIRKLSEMVKRLELEIATLNDTVFAPEPEFEDIRIHGADMGTEH